MRRTLPAIALFCAAVGVAGCNQPTSDPELKAAIAALANAQATKPAAETAGSDVTRAQMEAIRESVRDLKEHVGDGIKKLRSDLLVELSTVSTRVAEMERKLQASDAGQASAREASFAAKNDAAATVTAVAGLRVAVDELAAKVKNADPAEYMKLIREIADKEREVAAANAERDRAKQASDDAAARMTSLQVEIDGLKSQIAALGSEDVAKLRTRNRELERNLKSKESEYNQLKVLLDDMRSKGVVPPDPLAQPASTPAGDQWLSTFEARVNSANFIPSEQRHYIIAKMEKGDTPKQGDVLTILNDKNEKVCEFSVLLVYEDNTFGGPRLDTNISPAPTKGDKIVRARSAEAQGK